MTKRIPRQAPTYNDDGTITVFLTKSYITVIDEIDSDLAQFKWLPLIYANKPGNVYAHRHVPNVVTGRKEMVYMHRIIMERVLGRTLLPGEKIDHIHGNGLDNRRSELRLATFTQNNRNRGINRRSTSGYKGVSWHTHNKKWRARIKCDEKNIFIGYFKTPLDAHRAYCIAALTYHAPFHNFGDNSPFRGWTLADFAAPVKQLELPLKEAA